MSSGDGPGLQNRRSASFGVDGGFDSHSLPPFSLMSPAALGISPADGQRRLRSASRSQSTGEDRMLNLLSEAVGEILHPTACANAGHGG